MSTHLPLSSVGITLAAIVRVGAAHNLDAELLDDLRDVEVHSDLVYTKQLLQVYRAAVAATVALPEPQTETRQAARGVALSQLALVIGLLEQAEAVLKPEA